MVSRIETPGMAYDKVNQTFNLSKIHIIFTFPPKIIDALAGRLYC